MSMWVLALVLPLVGSPQSGASSPATQPAVELRPAMNEALRAYFAAEPGERMRLARPWEQATGLTGMDVEAWRYVIWDAYTTADGSEQRRRKAEIADRRVSLGDVEMLYTLRKCGVRPPDGWPLLISLQDDSITAQATNAREHILPSNDDFDGLFVSSHQMRDATPVWKHPKREALIEELVRSLIAYGDVDPNRVYLRGCGAGARGVLCIGPRTPDRWAALAAAAEGFDDEPLQLENLRNTPLTLHANRYHDDPRFQTVEKWHRTLKRLRDDGNPNEYVCALVEHSAFGLGSSRPFYAFDGTSSLVWLRGFARNPAPKRVLWTQPRIVQRNCYWLRLDDGETSTGAVTIDARIGGQCVSLSVKGVERVTVRLDDRLIDLDRPFTVTIDDEEAFTGTAPRSVAPLVKTLEERGDPALAYCAEMTFDVPGSQRNATDSAPTPADDYPQPSDPTLAANVAAALRTAGPNAAEWTRAIRNLPTEQRPGLYFLIANSPSRDLVALKAAFLLENTRLAYAAWQQAPWAAQVSEQQFFQYILPSAHFNERRDNWRRDFYGRFHERAWRYQDPIDATKWLNDTINDTLNVHYHAHKRPKSDQSPYESIAAEYASCTGLSVLLADACRAVGIPARLAGVAQWLDQSGNHTWVEVWGGPADKADGPVVRRWYNIGDKGSDPRQVDWVVERCRDQTDPDQLLNRVYAACFRRSELHFSLAWDLDIDYVPALNVTRFYTVPTEMVIDVPGGGRGQAVVYWNDEILLTAAGTGRLRLPLAHGEIFRMVLTLPDGTRQEQSLAP